MSRMLTLGGLIVAAGMPLVAETWSGVLVDGGCYAAEQRNVSPLDTEPYADTDRSYQLTYCRPTFHTKSFAVVENDGTFYAFDAGGNARAAALVRTAPKKGHLIVSVTGERAPRKKETIDVTALALQ